MSDQMWVYCYCATIQHMNSCNCSKRSAEYLKDAITAFLMLITLLGSVYVAPFAINEITNAGLRSLNITTATLQHQPDGDILPICKKTQLPNQDPIIECQYYDKQYILQPKE